MPKKHALLRAALVDQFGKRNYKITRNGDVYVYGPMPHSQITGWCLGANHGAPRWRLIGDILTAQLWLGEELGVPEALLNQKGERE